MNTEKFLHTDLQGYLKKDEHVTCISCQNCIRSKDKLISYKYNKRIQSEYSQLGPANKTASSHKKQCIFNLDQERRQLKVPYEPPRNFATTNNVNLKDTKGTGMIGAMSADGKGYVRQGAPKGETEDNIKRTFANESSY